MFLQNRHNAGINIQDLCLILLLFADDMVVIGATPEDIHLYIDRLYDYCNICGLQINIPKTKGIVFCKQEITKRNEI